MLQPKPRPLGEVYDLLKACGYPLLPDKGQALSIMQQASHITLCDGNRLVAWLGIHGDRHNVALDIAVHPDYRKRWCSPSLYRMVFAGIFGRGAQRITVTSSIPGQIKAAHKAGFRMVSEDLLTSRNRCHRHEVTLEFTKQDYQRKLAMRGKHL